MEEHMSTRQRVFWLIVVPLIVAVAAGIILGEGSRFSSQQIEVTPPNGQTESQDASNVVLSKCQWLELNLPQSQEAIATKFDLPINRIEVQREGCGIIIDGFVIRRGTDTEYASEIVVQVPEGGCIDASADAGFTGDHEQKPWGIRAYSGSVRAMVMTYWPWCDELR